MSDENRNKLNNERKKIEELKDCMEEMSNKKKIKIKTKIKKNEKYRECQDLFLILVATLELASHMFSFRIFALKCNHNLKSTESRWSLEVDCFLLPISGIR